MSNLTECVFVYLCVCPQLALTHSPPLSEIFVFTDASPKDAHLFSSVKALTLEKQCKVDRLGRFATQLNSRISSSKLSVILCLSLRKKSKITGHNTRYTRRLLYVVRPGT